MLAQPNLLVPRLVRSYVSWTERSVRSACVELEIAQLATWHRAASLPLGIEILPLAECGSDWMLHRLYNACSADTPGFRPASYLHIVSLRSAPYHDPYGIFVAWDGMRPVGFCIGRNRPGGRGLVNGLGVVPEYRRGGVARSLLRTTLQWLKEKNAREARIRVHPDNVGAARLYYAEGFLDAPGKG